MSAPTDSSASSTASDTQEYLFLFRGTDWDKSLSPNEIQTTMARFLAWFERLSAEGIMQGANPLTDQSRVVSGKNGRVVADGPFAEAKEAVGGYFLIKAANLDQAVAIAQECPTLEFGCIVEVRPVASECSTLRKARELGLEHPANHA